MTTEDGTPPERDPRDAQDPGAGQSGHPQLDRAPGERYRGMGSGRGPGGAPATPPSATASGGEAGAGTAAAGSTTRSIGAGIGAAVAGGVLYAALGEIDLGIGLLVIAVFIGWVVAIAVVWGAGSSRPIPRRWLVAGLFGAGAIALGLVLATAWARVEGGVLGPIDYANERYGPLAYVEVVLAGVAAAIRGR